MSDMPEASLEDACVRSNYGTFFMGDWSRYSLLEGYTGDVTFREQADNEKINRCEPMMKQ